MVRSRWWAVPALLAAAACAAAADKPAEKPAGKPADKAPAPACMVCGATCGLTPICVCKPGTKKQPKVEFSTECEPFCVPGCSSRPWPFGSHHAARGGCTSCCDEPCRCPGRVRSRKKLTKETVDKEVPVIDRSVGYLCCGCAGERPTSCSEPPAPRQPAGWWTRLWPWCSSAARP